MDEVTYMKTKFRQEQWEKLIADCQNSGLKVDEWCEKNKLAVMHTITGYVRYAKRRAIRFCLLFQNKVHLLILLKLK